MTTQQILKQIKQKDFPTFLKDWAALKDTLTGKDKQKLLIEILDDYYSDDSFGFYVKVFDKIIDSKVSLDFNVDHWAPTFSLLQFIKFPDNCSTTF